MVLFAVATGGCYVGNPKYGVNTAIDAWPSAPASVNRQAVELGGGWVRLWVPWTSVEPADGQYNFAAVEPEIQDLHDRGMRIMVSFNGTPIWARRAKQRDDRNFNARSCPAAYFSGDSVNGSDPNAGDGGPGTPPRPGVFGTFVSAFSTHFRGRLEAYEFWNEPGTDSGCWWAGSKAEFRNLIEVEGFDAAKAVDANVLVGGAGGSTIDAAGSAADGVDGWMTYWSDQKQRNILARNFDFFSFHLYSSVTDIITRFDAMDGFQRCNWDKSYCLDKYMLSEFGFMSGKPFWGTKSGYQPSPGISTATVLVHCAARRQCLSALVWDLYRPNPAGGGHDDYCLFKGFATPNVEACDDKAAMIRQFMLPH